MAGAISGTTIASLVALAAGAAMQAKANQDARDRQQRETQLSLQRQDDFARQAEQKALGQAKEFTTPDRQAEQQQIETQINDELLKPVESAQQINSQQATTQGDVSSDYSTAKAAADVNTLKNARVLAGLLAKTTAAGRLRSDEAIRMADTAAGIDRLGNFSRGQAAADQLGIQAAGVPDSGMMIGGQLLQGAGMMGAAGAFSGAGGGAAGGTGVTGTASTSAGAASPFATAGGGTGLRIPKMLTYKY